MRHAWALSAVLLLAACQDGGATDTNEEGAESAAAYDSSAPPAAPRAAPPQAAPGDTGTETAEATAPQLAYRYGYTLELPAGRVADVMAAHERACAEAGPQVCQVVGSRVDRPADDVVRASLELRARPDWLAGFRSRLAGDAEAAGGDVAGSTVDSEDLTRSIIDTEAHLAAKTTLRDRLQAILASRPGDLASVLEVERELARVQGEIDAARSTLEVMRTRVRTSRVTLEYRSQGVLAPDNAIWPLKSALENALSVFMTALAVIVTVLAFVLPFALIVTPLVWWWLRRRRAAVARRRAEAAAAADEPPG